MQARGCQDDLVCQSNRLDQTCSVTATRLVYLTFHGVLPLEAGPSALSPAAISGVTTRAAAMKHTR